MKRRIFSFVFVIAFLFLSVGTEKTEVFAAGKKSYIINAQDIQKFKKSGSKLKIKGEKKSIHEIEGFKNGFYNLKSGQAFQKTALSYKIAKNCEWKHRNVNQKIRKVSYEEMRKKIRNERNMYKRYLKSGSKLEYETNFSIVIVLKNNKIVKVIANGFF